MNQINKIKIFNDDSNDEYSKTFTLNDKDHTLANANPNVLCEINVNSKIQTNKNVTAHGKQAVAVEYEKATPGPKKRPKINNSNLLKSTISSRNRRKLTEKRRVEKKKKEFKTSSSRSSLPKQQPTGAVEFISSDTSRPVARTLSIRGKLFLFFFINF